MNLFGIGPGELVLVFVLALILLGPGKLPEVARALGKAVREFQAATRGLTEEVESSLREPPAASRSRPPSLPSEEKEGDEGASRPKDPEG